MFQIDIIPVVFLILSIIIVFISARSYTRIGKTPLILPGFAFFIISIYQAAVLAGIRECDPFLLIVKLTAYILLAVSIILILNWGIYQNCVMESQKKAREQIEEKVRERTSNLIRVNASLQEVTNEYYEIEKSLNSLDKELLLVRDELERRKVDYNSLYEKFLSIFEETPDPIIIINSDGSIININKSSERVFGLSNDGVTVDAISTTPLSPLTDPIGEWAEKIISDGLVYKEEIAFQNKSGFMFIAEVLFSRIIILTQPCILIQIHDINEDSPG
jgi:PAS domain S-box-containing protein